MNRNQRRAANKSNLFDILFKSQKQKDIDADLWVQKNRDVVKTTKILSEQETIKYFEDGKTSMTKEEFEDGFARIKKQIDDLKDCEVRGYQIDTDSEGRDSLRAKILVDDINKTGRRFV